MPCRTTHPSQLRWRTCTGSTIDLLSSVARRNSAARLMILGTYRPDDAGASVGLLLGTQNELALHRQCKVLPLTYLSRRPCRELTSAKWSSVIDSTRHRRDQIMGLRADAAQWRTRRSVDATRSKLRLAEIDFAGPQGPRTGCPTETPPDSDCSTESCSDRGNASHPIAYTGSPA